jgi:hypothetical protein
LTVLAPAQQANKRAGTRHKTPLDWPIQMVQVVARWLQKPWVLVGDGAYAWGRWAWACRAHHVTLMARMRLDARRYASPEPVPPGKRGPQPQQGPRLPTLQSRVDEAKHQGQEIEGAWDGGGQKRVRVLTAVALWPTPGAQPRAARWVLVVDPAGAGLPGAFFRTDLALAPAQIGAWFILRWHVEVPFEDGRRSRGVEPQRQWAAQAIARTTPALFGLFSLVCVMAYRLTAVTALGAQSTAWYLQEEGTFADVLAFVSRALWAEKYFNQSPVRDEQVILRANDWAVLLDQLASAV